MKYAKLYGAVTLVCLMAVFSAGLLGAEDDPMDSLPADGFHKPFEATGTEFTITGNPYFPNLKITSSEEVHIYLEAVNSMVSYHIEATGQFKHQAKITIYGLDGFFTGEESGKLCRHEDGAFEDSFKLKKYDATYTYHQDIRKPHHVYILPERGTVYIGDEANGNSPTTTPPLPYNYDSGSRTYTLTQDISDYVVITANNITLDGFITSSSRSAVISGTNTGYGIYLNTNTNVTITDCTVQYFSQGIYVSGGSTNTITSCTVISNQNQNIYLYNTDYNTVSYCTAYNSAKSHSIVASSSDYNEITHNTVYSNAYSGICLSSSSQYNGVYYNTSRNNTTVGIRLDTVTNNTVSSNTLYSNSSTGLYLYAADTNTLSNNSSYSSTSGAGIALVTGSDYNIVTYNTVTANGMNGIALTTSSANNTMANNTANSNTMDGIRIWSSNNNTVSTNTCQSNVKGGVGILSCSGYSITVTGNTLCSNAYGVTMTNNSTTTSILVYQNNIFNNTTWNAYSTNAIELSTGSPDYLGNFWGHVIAPGFTAGPGAGADSNAANVTDDPYLVKNGWLCGYSTNQEVNLPSARGAGSNSLAPRISDANATVDLASGNVNIAVPLTYIIPFNSLPTNIVAYYNSIAPTDGLTTPLGANWTHTFNMRLITQTDGSIIQVTESGREILFWQDSEVPAHWISYPHYGLYRTITIDSSTGNYVLTNKDRTTLTFLAANGKFYKATDLNGHTTTATYDASGDLDYVTLANGEQIDFTYSSNCLTGIEDPLGYSTTVNVYGGQLAYFQKYDGVAYWQHSFSYHLGTDLMDEQTFPGSLDSRSYTFTSGKVTAITGPDSEDITIAYYSSPDYAVVTGRDDKVDTVYFDTQLDVWTRWIDEETQREFDDNGNLTREIKPSGAQTLWSYDSRGNCLSTTNAAGANTQYIYGDSTNPDLPTEIGNALGITTTLTYNTAGQLTQEIEDAGAGTLNRETTWDYYSTGSAAVIGQLYQYHRDPDTLNLTTTYEYNTNGYGTKETVTGGGFSLITGERITNDIGWVTTSYNVDYGTSAATVYIYDNRGNRLTETDPYGIETDSDFDLLDRMTQRTVDSAVGGLALVTAWTYNWGGVTSQTTDPSGLNISSSTVYDAAGKVTSRTDPMGATTEYSYYDNGRLWKTKRQLTSAPDYAWTEYFYDSNGNQTGIIDAGNHAISMTYDTIDRLITTTDVASSYATGSVYDLLDRQTTFIDARGYPTVTTYDNLNQVKSVRTAQSNITIGYGYDAVGRRTSVTGPWYDTDGDGVADAGEYVNPAGTISPPVAYTVYDPADRVTETYINNTSTTDTLYYYSSGGDRYIHYVRNLLDNSTASYQDAYSYFNKNNQVYKTVLDPAPGLDEQTYFYFDNAGRQTAATAAYGSAVSTTSYTSYDAASRVITSYTGSTTYATGFTYNARGQVLTSTDALGRTTTNAYDISGRLTSTTDALGNVVSYGYNVEDLMTSLTYVRSGVNIPTVYFYNDQHRLIRTDQPGYNISSPTTTITNTTYTGYDANGNVTSRTDGAGVNIQFTFDNINRLTLKQSSTVTVSYGFDAASNTLTISDTNTSTANEYNELNRLTKTTNYMYTIPKIFQYTYYNDGVRKTMTDPGSIVTAYTFDKARRLTNVAYNSVSAGSYTYNALGLRTQETLGNNSTVTYTYDSTTRWLTGVYNQTSAPVLISSFVYTHDLVGNRATETKYLNSSTEYITYTYGSLYRLMSEAHTGPLSTTISFNYDGPGNRTKMTKDYTQITNYAFNNANQCISWTNTSGVCFIDNYDGSGNLITETNYSTGTMTEWDYDYENHQTVYSTTGTSAIYTIDAMGRRTSKTVNGSLVAYTHDGANVYADMNGFSGNLRYKYITPFLDQNLTIMTGTTKYYYLHDGLGSVRNLLDSSQNIMNTYDYWAFGGLRLDSEQVTQRYKFTGREYDSESSTYYYRARQYRPQWGRFLSQDPEGYSEGVNLYTYCGNNPVNYVDPWGLWKIIRTSKMKRGLAIAQLGDTLDGLARLVKLDRAEISKWSHKQSLASLLAITANNPLLTYLLKPEHSLMTGEIYDFPNTVHVAIGDVSGILVKPLAETISNNIIEEAQKDNYFVKSNFDCEANDVTGMLSDPNIWGFAFFGHGGSKKEPKSFLAFENSMLWPRQIDLKYHLGKVILNSCYSNGIQSEGGATFKSKFIGGNPYGVFKGFDGRLLVAVFLTNAYTHWNDPIPENRIPEKPRGGGGVPSNKVK